MELEKRRNIIETIVLIGVMILVIVVCHRALALGLMAVVDTIGEIFNINVVRAIDFLNNIYFM